MSELSTNLLKRTGLLLLICLCGCAATVHREGGDGAGLGISPAAKSRISMAVQGSEVASSSVDWNALRAEWDSAMRAATSSAGIAYTYHEGEIPITSEVGTGVLIKVENYRFISREARNNIGIFIGNAFVDAEATFFELPQRKAVSTRRYNTCSTAWQGVFAPMTVAQIRAICDEIVKEIVEK